MNESKNEKAIQARKQLMVIHETAYHARSTTPVSFGERARSRSERDGSCFFAKGEAP